MARPLQKMGTNTWLLESARLPLHENGKQTVLTTLGRGDWQRA